MGRALQSRSPLRLVLASGSPRRRELLMQAGLHFEVAQPSIDESIRLGERPLRYVARLARDKARAVIPSFSALVIAADTSVVIDGRVLGKPADANESRRMLRLLAGRPHQVITGVAVRRTRDDASIEFVCQTRVEFERLSATQIRWYAATAEPYDKAGGYAIQGIAGSFIRSVRGSYSNVVGLPMAETLEALHQLGFALPWSAQ